MRSIISVYQKVHQVGLIDSAEVAENGPKTRQRLSQSKWSTSEISGRFVDVF
jgi:hypothetical protein